MLASRWGDWPVGTQASVLRSWRDPHGCGWVRAASGRTADGRPITMTYPVGALAPEEGTAR